jgi:hypothetical protein
LEDIIKKAGWQSIASGPMRQHPKPKNKVLVNVDM